MKFINDLSGEWWDWLNVSPAWDAVSSPGDGYDVFSSYDGVIITLILPIFHLKNLQWLLQALWIQNKSISHDQCCWWNHKRWLVCLLSDYESLSLTWSFYSDFELSAAGSFSVDFKISHFFHPHTLRLETPARCPAGIRVTGCEGQVEDWGYWLDWKKILEW